MKTQSLTVGPQVTPLQRALGLLVIPLQRALGMLVVLSLVGLAGCHVLVSEPDEGDRSWWYYCDEFGCYRCDSSGCIFPEYLCDGGDCGACGSRGCSREPVSCEVMADCPRGQRCLDGACVARPSEPCREHGDCGAGSYCHDGTCKEGQLCSGPTDGCEAAGEGFSCDERGCCVPAPAGPKPCLEPSECGEAGVCVNGLCGTCSGDCGGGKTCELDRHCGEGRACSNGQCVNRCEDATSCGSGQTCHDVLRICVLAEPTPCEGAGQCGDGLACVDGACKPLCTGGSCSNQADVCTDPLLVDDQELALCVPGYEARPECALSRDCTGNEQCVNGVCRTICDEHKDCATCDDGPVCGKGGFCMSELEASPECVADADCGSGRVCLDARCTSL